ncbi:mannosyl-glycoprotein endo-beta-N-acetylglucosamidase, partial [Halapricum sp. CBA1109]|uniref:glucosaminidase domain-containing protein n=1 Tax=Halapricum sp. CBA1109 TaxID=2668068 RepID=UPI0013B9ED29
PAECADSFSSFEDSIRQVMSYVDREYLSSDGRYYVEPTLAGMNQNYATDDRWANKIADIYNRLVATL